MTRKAAPQNAPLAVIAGAGPGLGAALKRRFQAGGYRAVGLSRTAQPGGPDEDVLECDLTDAQAVAATMAHLIGAYGPPKVVIHNPAKLTIAPFENADLADFEAAWRVMTLSAALLARHSLPAMAAAGGGAFLVSGATASLRGGKNFSAFASAKAGLRGLTQSLAREYGPKGVHVAHIVLDGILDTAKSRSLHKAARMMNTHDVADVYWSLAHQPQTTWTHELDLRPMGENF